MTQRLTTMEQRSKLLANAQARPGGHFRDPEPVIKLFTPDANATWLLVALDPADGDTAYGLCDIGVGLPELGHVKLSGLESIVGPRGQPVLRDRYFRPTRSLCDYARLARAHGSIVD